MDEQRVRELELELELRRRRQQQPYTHEAFTPPPNTLRAAAAGAAVGPSKTVSGILDFLNEGAARNAERQAATGFPAARGPKARSQEQRREAALTPKVDALRDMMAGGPAEGTATTVAEGMTGGLLFPGGPLANAASGGLGALVGDYGNKQDWNPLLTLGLSTLAGVGPAALLETGQAARGGSRFLAAGRAKDALARSSPEGLEEAKKFQQWAAKRGYFLLPSQSTAKATPGLLDLETSVFQSRSPAVQALREKVFGQYSRADSLARQTVDEMPGRVLPEEEAASQVVGAAEELRKGRRQVGNIAAKPFYEEGKAVLANPTQQASSDVRRALVDARTSTTSGDVRYGAAKLEAMLDELKKAKGREVTPADLRDVHERYTAWLDTPNEKGTILPDTAKQELRLLSERSVRKLAEDIAPALREGREVAARFKSDFDYDPFDAVTREGRTTATRTALAQLLRQPRIATELAEGVKAPQFEAATGKRVGETTLGANIEAPSNALKTAADAERRKAFRLMQGEENPQAPFFFASALAPDEAVRAELARAVTRLGGDGGRLGENLDLLTALGRPTSARGSNIDPTAISPIQTVQAAGAAGPLQVHQARASIVRAMINRMSDASVAKALSEPNAVAALEQIAGAKAMSPRAALAALMTAQGQMQE